MKETEPTRMEEALGPELDEALFALDELAVEDPEQALTMFDALPEPVQALATFQLVLARAHQGLEQYAAASDLVRGVLEADAENADAHHLMGDLLEDMGETEQANRHFLRVLALDEKALAEIPAADRLSDALVRSVLEAKLKALLATENIRLEVRQAPTSDEVSEGMDPRCLFDMPEEGCFVAYLSNLQAELGDLKGEDLEDALVFSAASELAGAFELDEADLAEFGIVFDEPDDAELN